MRIESNGLGSGVDLGTVAGGSALGAGPAGVDRTSSEELARDRAEVAPSGGTEVWAPPTSATVGASAAPASPLLSEIVDAMASDGSAGLERYLESHPGAARELATGSREGIEATLRAGLEEELGGGAIAIGTAYLAVDTALDRFEAALVEDVRETVRSTAVLAIDEQLAALDGANVDDVVEAVRTAPADSPLAELGARIGVRGDALDATRVRTSLHVARGELTALRASVEGQTWSPEELPGTARRVMDAMGLSDAPEGSMAAAAFHRPELEAADAAHEAQRLAEGIHGGLEGAEVAHTVLSGTAALAEASAAGASGAATGAGAVGVAAAAALPVLVTIGAIWFGVELHHQIAENRLERTESARRLGL